MRKVGAALLAVLLAAGCGEPALCASSGGEWDGQCGMGPSSFCVDGQVEGPVMRTGQCSPGCNCPEGFGVWDEAAGCVSESACAGE